ncbi:DUF2567 domain-containing protein [Solwaraspora sp. WMMA2056]|uniref:DUF2567 domain-containing protein n=1 Tax=Solwaraspora sp. WMMA2056 TaxID=3015161 RepID=UPI00259B6EAF|nr:DUF2567 domain-containing protein [Solwaraspora sp. WMMA2056]WJK38089.1 DUF2567 domain-containing protein [Solwaraspora sp. WMMA2056]
MSSPSEPGQSGEPGQSVDLPTPTPTDPGATVAATSGRAAPWRRPAVLVVAAMVLGGVLLGLAWSTLTPWVPVVKTEQGAAVRGGDPEYFVAADGWFALLGLGFGILAGICAWALPPRRRGPAGLLAVTIGGLGAAAVAWALGRQIGLAGYRQALEAAEVGATLSRPPDLHAGDIDLWFGVLPALNGAFFAPAFGAALVYTMLAGWSRYPDLRPDAPTADPPTVEGGSGAQAPPVSSGSPAPRAPAAEPAPPAPGAAATPPD